jgi:hypothetical protein
MVKEQKCPKLIDISCYYPMKQSPGRLTVYFAAAAAGLALGGATSVNSSTA